MTDPSQLPLMAPALGGQGPAPASGDAPAFGPKTGFCRYCHRPLTNPVSVAAGAGPICGAIEGVRYDGVPGSHRVAGQRGATKDSLHAVGRAIAKNRAPSPRFYLVSYAQQYDQTPETEQRYWAHGLIVDSAGKLKTITDGFSSGYSGEGPCGLQQAVGALTSAGYEAAGSIVLDEAHASQLFTGHLDPLSLLGLVTGIEISHDPNSPERAILHVTPHGLHQLILQPLATQMYLGSPHAPE